MVDDGYVPLLKKYKEIVVSVAGYKYIWQLNSSTTLSPTLVLYVILRGARYSRELIPSILL
jgi:hypothetical protein